MFIAENSAVRPGCPHGQPLPWTYMALLFPFGRGALHRLGCSGPLSSAGQQVGSTSPAWERSELKRAPAPLKAPMLPQVCSDTCGHRAPRISALQQTAACKQGPAGLGAVCLHPVPLGALLEGLQELVRAAAGQKSSSAQLHLLWGGCLDTEQQPIDTA